MVTDQPAYILHRRRYRESSLLIDAITLDYGRVSLVARGVSKNGWEGALQLFQPLRLSWSGRSRLKNISQVETVAPAIPLVAVRLYCAFYLNELLLKLYPESDPNPLLFAAYVRALAELSQSDVEIALRRFELQLLHALGVVPDLLHEGHGSKPIDESLNYQWSVRYGFTPVARNGISGRDLTRMASLGMDHVAIKSVAKNLMRCVINEMLNGKKLKSRDMIRQIMTSSKTKNQIRNETG